MCGISRSVDGARQVNRALWYDHMIFILGIIFFVGVVGALDTRLPWPCPRSSAKNR
jgi:hypothetical protein